MRSGRARPTGDASSADRLRAPREHAQPARFFLSADARCEQENDPCSGGIGLHGVEREDVLRSAKSEPGLRDAERRAYLPNRNNAPLLTVVAERSPPRVKWLQDAAAEYILDLRPTILPLAASDLLPWGDPECGGPSKASAAGLETKVGQSLALLPQPARQDWVAAAS